MRMSQHELDQGPFKALEWPEEQVKFSRFNIYREATDKQCPDLFLQQATGVCASAQAYAMIVLLQVGCDEPWHLRRVWACEETKCCLDRLRRKEGGHSKFGGFGRKLERQGTGNSSRDPRQHL